MAKAKYKEKDEKDRPDRPDRPRPRNDAYVVMLIITLLAIAAGCVFMYLDTEEFVGVGVDERGVQGRAAA